MNTLCNVQRSALSMNYRPVVLYNNDTCAERVMIEKGQIQLPATPCLGVCLRKEQE